MKKLVSFYVLLVIAIYLGLHIQKDPGYILLALGVWTIEMPLWFFGALLIAIISTVHYSLNFLHQIGSLRYRCTQYLKLWRNKTSQCQTKEGLIAYSEGNWSRAEKKLIQGLPSSDSPLINYLTAAKAAQEMNHTHRRDKYLREAQQSMPETKIAVLLTQAELQLQSKQYEQANATLKHLHNLVPKHPHVLRLMLSLYEELDDWLELSKLLPNLSKNKIISTEKLLELEKKIVIHQVSSLCGQKETTLLCALWDKISKKLKTDPEFIHFYASTLRSKKEDQHAELILRQSIKKTWEGSLIELYGQLENIDVNKQLKFTESFIRSHPNSASLYQALGIISKRLQLWGKSKTYLQKSAELNPTTKTYFELADLYQLLNDESLACKGFKKAIELSLPKPCQDTSFER